ncbi:hypothetical protein F66182_2831 [Fusarium sp. NRRL 66182]|nr:hypothetical protein F66182_2831 [Fusarium sp. NRRL 66182]
MAALQLSQNIQSRRIEDDKVRFQTVVALFTAVASASSAPPTLDPILTSTAAAPVRTATVTATKAAVIRTMYKFGGPRKMVRRTIIVTRYAAGPTVSAPETTATSVTTMTQTDQTLTTETDTQANTITETAAEFETVASTETATSTTTVNADPCGGRSLSSPSVVLQATALADTRGCCQRCFSVSDCVFFRSTGNFCEIFVTRQNVLGQCTSEQCTRGKTPLIAGPSSGQDCYIGACIGPRTA